MTKKFEDIVAWQKAHEFVRAVYTVTSNFPKEELFALTSQFRRAAISIAANIAEGYKKLGKMDKLRFYNISQGSLEECRYYVLLSKDLGYISTEVFKSLNEKIGLTSWYINKYADSINQDKGVIDNITVND